MSACFMGCDPPEGSGEERFYVAAFSELTIYGHSVDAWTKAKYSEDWRHTKGLRERGMDFGCWHSVACPDGEIGSQDLSVCRESNYAEFVEAREQGWPDQEQLTAAGPIAAVYVPDDSGQLTEVWNSLEGDKEGRPDAHTGATE